MKYLKLLMSVMVVGLLMVMPIRALDFTPNSEVYLVYNVDLDQIIVEQDSRQVMAPASMIKLLSALVVYDRVSDLSNEVMVTEVMLKGLKSADASVIGLKVNEVIRYEDLLYGLLVASGGDAAQVLAVSVGGDLAGFVELMNTKAKDLGMKNSNFTNPTGLDDPQQYSTAYDIMLLMKEVLQYPKLRAIIGTMYHTTRTTNLHPNGISFKHTLKALDRNNSTYSSFLLGGKTGATEAAGRCSVGYGKIGSMTYIVVVMKAPLIAPRNLASLDIRYLFKWVDTNIQPVSLGKQGDIVGELTIANAKQERWDVVLPKDLDWYQVVGQPLPQVTYQVVPKITKAPVQAGTVLASVQILIDNQPHSTFDVSAEADINSKAWLSIEWIIGIASGSLLVLIVLIRSLVGSPKVKI